MTLTRLLRRGASSHALAAVLCFGALSSGALAGEGSFSRDADELLRSSCEHLAGLTAFSLNADIDGEITTQQGEKLQFSSHADVAIQRPDRFHMTKRSRFASIEYLFDGKQVTIHGKRAGVHAQFAAPGTIDGAISEVEMTTGLSAPAADLLFSDPYSVLSNGVLSSQYLGVDYVHGVECHHLAFREAEVDWQLWVQADGEPLPLKYVITSKWVFGAPQYAVVLRGWNTRPQFSRREFEFSPPAGSKRLSELPVNDLGEVDLTGEVK